MSSDVPQAREAGRAEGPVPSIVICCYTLARWSDLVDAVAEADRQAGGVAEVLVCVDHNDALLERAREQLPRATVIENIHERGLSGARNTAVEHASGEVLVFLDDDAVRDRAGCGRCSTRSPTARLPSSAARPHPRGRTSTGWFPAEFDWVVGCSYRGLPRRRARVRNVMGCNMAFRREVFKAGLRFLQVGRTGDDTAGCEETELCIRVQQLWSNAAVVFELEAVVRHRVPQSRCSWTSPDAAARKVAPRRASPASSVDGTR